MFSNVRTLCVTSRLNTWQLFLINIGLQSTNFFKKIFVTNKTSLIYLGTLFTFMLFGFGSNYFDGRKPRTGGGHIDNIVCSVDHSGFKSERAITGLLGQHKPYRKGASARINHMEKLKL